MKPTLATATPRAQTEKDKDGLSPFLSGRVVNLEGASSEMVHTYVRSCLGEWVEWAGVGNQAKQASKLARTNSLPLGPSRTRPRARVCPSTYPLLTFMELLLVEEGFQSRNVALDHARVRPARASAIEPLFSDCSLETRRPSPPPPLGAAILSALGREEETIQRWYVCTNSPKSCTRMAALLLNVLLQTDVVTKQGCSLLLLCG